MGSSEPDLRSSPVNSHLSLSRQTLDAGSQTSISGDVSSQRASAAPVLSLMPQGRTGWRGWKGGSGGWVRRCGQVGRALVVMGWGVRWCRVGGGG
jgi:hypothetical protein